MLPVHPRPDHHPDQDHHPDLYRLITYGVDSSPPGRELVWNPRNAPAPASIELRDGRIATRRHVHEPLLVAHAPSVGHLVLVDVTPEWAEHRAARLAGRLWARGETHGRRSQDELEAALLEIFMWDVEMRLGIAVPVTTEMAARNGWVAS